MLHIRTTADAVPSVGAASRRALFLPRSTVDEAPGVDGGIGVLVIDQIAFALLDLFVDIELLLMAIEGSVESRGPPTRRVTS